MPTAFLAQAFVGTPCRDCRCDMPHLQKLLSCRRPATALFQLASCALQLGSEQCMNGIVGIVDVRTGRSMSGSWVRCVGRCPTGSRRVSRQAARTQFNMTTSNMQWSARSRCPIAVGWSLLALDEPSIRTIDDLLSGPGAAAKILASRAAGRRPHRLSRSERRAAALGDGRVVRQPVGLSGAAPRIGPEGRRAAFSLNCAMDRC